MMMMMMMMMMMTWIRSVFLFVCFTSLFEWDKTMFPDPCNCFDGLDFLASDFNIHHGEF